MSHTAHAVDHHRQGLRQMEQMEQIETVEQHLDCFLLPLPLLQPTARTKWLPWATAATAPTAPTWSRPVFGIQAVQRVKVLLP